MSIGTQYDIVQLSNTYRRIGGAWYRDAIARRPDGTLRAVSVLRDLVEDAA